MLYKSIGFLVGCNNDLKLDQISKVDELTIGKMTRQSFSTKTRSKKSERNLRLIQKDNCNNFKKEFLAIVRHPIVWPRVLKRPCLF